MRKITHIVLHCTATSRSTTVESIQRYWKEQLGWKNPGYHRLIRTDGTVAELQDYSLPTNGVAGHNANSIHISYIGGIDRQGKPADNRTQAQRITMERLVRELKALHPDAKVVGHRDFPNVKKACPSFDVATWLKQIGL